MQAFVAVAEDQGFASAARRLKISPPAVTRAIAALENRLGVKLLNRTTRIVRATEAGLRYLEDARRILGEIDAADEAAAGINAEPRGHLSITAPVLFGRMHVIPGIIEYLDRYPGTEISAVFLDRVVNLLEEGLDVGIRIGELPDSTMRALPVGSVSIVVVASPRYLENYGLPKSPDDLHNHAIISSSAGSKFIDWHFDSAKGARTLRIKSRLTVTTNDAAIAATQEGFGITRLPSYQVAPQLSNGELQCILVDFEPPARPVHIVHREGRDPSARIRAFIDLMAARLRSDKSLSQH
jgi:DNA-binding transcriptional LysR family regulator